MSDVAVGGVGGGIVEVVMPLSGAILQWRVVDEHYRVLPDRAAEADMGWHPYSASSDLEIRADGDVWAHPSWLIAWGETPPGGDVEVMRTDDTVVALATAGRIWAGEWVGHGEPVRVRYDDRFPHTLRIPRPESLVNNHSTPDSTKHRRLPFGELMSKVRRRWLDLTGLALAAVVCALTISGAASGSGVTRPPRYADYLPGKTVPSVCTDSPPPAAGWTCPQPKGHR
jgi:hypothetical protein